MKITLSTPLNQGQSGTIGFNLSIVVHSGADRFGHDGPNTFIGNALPVLAVRDSAGWHLDPYTNNGESFYTVISNFDVTLVHPTSLLTPATGTSTETVSGSTTTTRATATNVRDFARAAGPFSKITGTSAKGLRGQRVLGERDQLEQRAVDADHREERVGRTFQPVRRLPVWRGGFTDYATDLFNGITGSGCGITWQSAAEKLTNSMGYWDAHSSRYGAVVYGFGKRTLHDLRRLMGDTAMTNLTRSYAQSHWYGVSTVADFKAAAQAAAGATSLTAFWSAHRVEG